uniref:RRM domain-containing protein n=1 Tax=Alexandrium catenella TaxID=2925 RepID=A0A7S1LQF8_ALECA
MMDKATGRSRGFGFCTFHSNASLVKALSTQQTIDGKLVDCKVCSPKGEVQMPYKPNRLFVGGLPQSADENKLRDFFSKFGAVTDARIMTDKDSGRSRGFGYVTFQSPQSCELALANHTLNTIDDKWVEVKRCTEKVAMAGNAVPQALVHLSAQQLAQVAQLTAQLQSILGQPLVQSLQTKPPPSGSKGRGKGGQKGGNAYAELVR